MTDVQGTPNPPKTGGGIKGFMKSDTAGMPNWVWLLVIAGGITLAIGIKMYASKKSTGNATTTGTTPDSGLGLAIDPTTGLPYAVEGLVPVGGTAGGTQGTQGPTGPQGPQGPPGPSSQASIRERFSLGANNPFDKSHPQGANMFSGPGPNNTVTGFLPWKSNVTVVSGPIPSGTPGGQGQPFYKLSNGMYILAQDLTGLPLNAGGPSSTLLVQPAWPGDTTQTRISA